MSISIPGLVMGFREGLEAFLVIALILKYLSKIGQDTLKKNVFQGGFAGVGASIVLGVILTVIATSLGSADKLAKVWESIASLAAIALVSTFIVWMIRHGESIKEHVHGQVKTHLSKWGVFFVSFIMVAREGTEIALFNFVGKYNYLSTFTGVFLALVLAVLVYFSLVKVNLHMIFKITLIYLILQAGFLLGYSIHEGLSALKSYGYLASDSVLLTKAFNLSGTVLNHKSGVLGLPMFALFGWYSKPEWIQLIIHYSYVILTFAYWANYTKKSTIKISQKLVNGAVV